MNLRNGILLTVISLALPVRASLVTNFSSGTLNAVVPDNSASGISKTINVPSIPGLQIADVNITLNLAGGWNGDLYAYLTHDLTTTAILLNRIGVNGPGQDGFGGAGMNVTLNDQALGLSDIHLYGSGSPVTGIFSPDGRLVDPSVVANSTPRTAMLNLFNGQLAAGNWTLFVADVAGGSETTLSNWSLEMELAAVPEPGQVLASALTLLGVGGYMARQHLRRSAQKKSAS